MSAERAVASDGTLRQVAVLVEGSWGDEESGAVHFG